MARYTCARCGADENTMNVPHLCKDLKKRYERNKKAVDIVSNILRENLYNEEDYNNGYYEMVATAIVQALSGRDLGVD